MFEATAQFRMADRLAGGKLAERLLELEDAGNSYDHIGRVLFADYGIEVTRQTVGNWVARVREASSAEAVGG